MENFYITTPIFYVNANPHLGHAYSGIVADAATRFHKMLGQQAFFLTGTDEHGDKIAQAAEKRNSSPRQFADQISARFRAILPRLSIDCDYFARTTDERHIRAVQSFLQRVYDAGDIYFGEFGGHYCFGCERFYTEKELEDGLCPQHKTKPEYISEKNYFFRMSRYLPWLREYIVANPGLIRPARYRKEALAMLESGALEDLCISRPKSRLTWGVDLPFDSNYVCYVWFDALITYISGPGWPDGEEYRQFWPGEHLIAKDILKPHAIFWPCMLKAAGLPIYKHLNVHGYWLSRDAKMSKSLGNVVDPVAMAAKYGLDSFRYFLLREMHFGSDASFSETALVARANADLANDLGNLFSRTLSMCARYLDSRAPAALAFNEDDKAIFDLRANCMPDFLRLFENMEYARALESLWHLVDALNKYVDRQAPWSLHKNGDSGRLATVMAVLLGAMRQIALCLWPVMPEASIKMLAQLGEKREGQGDAPPVRDLEARVGDFDFLPVGQKLAPASNLFPRIEKSGEKAPEAVQKIKEKAPKDAGKLGLDAFRTYDLRIGEIISAQRHPDADRILLLRLDFGPLGERTILSGIAGQYDPASLKGKKVCAILNLEPRKIRGLLSEGMILTAGAGDALALLSPDRDLENGASVS